MSKPTKKTALECYLQGYLRNLNLVNPTSGFWYFAIKRLSPLFWYRRAWLKRTQWYSRERLERIQLRLLQNLIRHCYKTVPYYRTYMDDEGLKPDDIRTLEDIKLFPILTKDQVVEREADLISQKYPRWLIRKTQTGGTTNKPINLYRDIFSIANEHAFARRQYDWAGIGLRDKCAHFLARRVVDPNKTEGALWQYDPFMKELVFSNYHLSAETAKTYLSVMEACGVRTMYSFPSALRLLSEAYVESNCKLKVRSIMTTAETLDPSIKDRAEDVFQCKVFNNYGASERVCYIFMCDHGSYHVQPEFGLTEFEPILTEDGGAFKVIATGFWNYTMPLIRYDTSDVVKLSHGTCSCGRQFEVVDSIMGREGDIIRTLSGRILGPAILTYLVRGTSHVLECQIVQDKIDHVFINYVPTDQFTQTDLDNFKASIDKHLPKELSYTLEERSVIGRTRSAKLRPVICQIT
jgi:phenylacetate-CoA ligase